MTKVFTDQLAALPLSEVYIHLSASEMYIAAIALEGRVLNVYENDDKPLMRNSLSAILQCLAAFGCPQKSFIVDSGAGMDALVSLVLPEQSLAVVAM
ncbi:MAG: DUF6482 family protein [Zhongshania sp.]|uniref:DUF6482 family protein n=1 Tax=Zhongshania sp. TaxID=1971902 RepID=UPI00261ABFE3|nr:DUF6482 family protein [Zhongshania sp.]MDF1691825.1 DUF6482 family protein [Zhongshania sp.]